MNYYYANAKNDPIGPRTEEQMRELHRNGKLRDDSWVLVESAAEWHPFASVFPPLANPTSHQPVATDFPPVATPLPQADSHCCGYGGWLRLFCALHIFIIPLIILPVFLIGTTQARDSDARTLLFAMIGSILFGVYAGIKVRWAWPGAARTAKQFLVAALICAVGCGAYSERARAALFFGVNAILIAAWLGYFCFSKRVRTLPVKEGIWRGILSNHSRRLWRIVREMVRMACIVVGCMFPVCVFAALGDRELDWESLQLLWITSVAVVGAGALGYSLVEWMIEVTKKKKTSLQMPLVLGVGFLASVIFLLILGWSLSILNEPRRNWKLGETSAQIFVVYMVFGSVAAYRRNRAMNIASKLMTSDESGNLPPVIVGGTGCPPSELPPVLRPDNGTLNKHPTTRSQ